MIDRIKKTHPFGCLIFCGGWGGIRTPGSLATSAVFKTVAFDRSATHPKLFSTVLSNLAVLVMRKLCLLLPRFAVKTVAFDRSATHPKLYLLRQA